MQKLGDKSVIAHTYENTMATRLFDEVMVVTDSQIIFDEITHYGGYVTMSKKTHESGSDRIAEAIADLEVDIVVNVQGDEPFVNKEALVKLLNIFYKNNSIQVGSLMQVMKIEEQIYDPNYVKVAIDKNMNALMFSRSPIPYRRNPHIEPVYYEHIGIYAFKKTALMNFTSWEITPLENAEKIECLRYLENSVNIKMVISDYMGIEIDTPEDLERANTFYSKNK
jgi:3-deoxy-D-manno-octulosonate cytidylyltransferase